MTVRTIDPTLIITDSQIEAALVQHFTPNTGNLSPDWIRWLQESRILLPSPSRRVVVDGAFGANGFLRKSIEALYVRRGFQEGDQQSVVDEIQRLMEKFCLGEVTPQWADVYRKLEREGAVTEDPIAPSVDAACELGCLLLRLFYVEALSADLLRAWKRYETFEYALNTKYRDHYVHLLHNFLIGCCMMDGLLPSILQWHNEYGKQPVTPEYLLLRLTRSWLLAALFHDIGYPAESLKTFRNNMQDSFFDKIPGYSLSRLNLEPATYLEEEMKDIFTMISYIFTEDEFSFDFERLARFQQTRHYPQRLIFGAMNALLQDRMEDLDHGVMSAVFLLLTLKVDVHEFTVDSFRNRAEFDRMIRDTRVSEFERERCELLEDAIRASLAIALHNLRAKGYPGMTIDFRTHPISYLLSLVDDLQEWDRRKDDYSKFVREEVEIKAVASCPSVRNGVPPHPPDQAAAIIDRIFGNDPKVGEFRARAIECNSRQDLIILRYSIRDRAKREAFLVAVRHLFERNLSFGPAVLLVVADNQIVEWRLAEYDVKLRIYSVSQ